MTLESAICSVCQESHLRQANGLMSIHTNAAGERCAGSPPKGTGSMPPRAEPRQRDEPGAERDPERQAAYDAAVGTRRDRYGRESAGPFDRRIYMNEHSQKVNGGSPGSGKKR
jgi:hypothetical protein